VLYRCTAYILYCIPGGQHPDARRPGDDCHACRGRDQARDDQHLGPCRFRSASRNPRKARLETALTTVLDIEIAAWDSSTNSPSCIVWQKNETKNPEFVTDCCDFSTTSSGMELEIERGLEHTQN